MVIYKEGCNFRGKLPHFCRGSPNTSPAPVETKKWSGVFCGRRGWGGINMARKRKIDELRSYAEYDDNFDEEGDELEDGVSAARAYVGEESEFLDDDDAWEKLQKDREKLD